MIQYTLAIQIMSKRAVFADFYFVLLGLKAIIVCYFDLQSFIFAKGKCNEPHIDLRFAYSATFYFKKDCSGGEK